MIVERGKQYKETLFKVKEVGRVRKVCYQRIVREGLEEKVTLEQKSESCHGGSMGRPRGKESRRKNSKYRGHEVGASPGVFGVLEYIRPGWPE